MTEVSEQSTVRELLTRAYEQQCHAARRLAGAEAEADRLRRQLAAADAEVAAARSAHEVHRVFVGEVWDFYRSEITVPA